MDRLPTQNERPTGGNNNIADSISARCAICEPPSSTAIYRHERRKRETPATIGRYIRRRGYDTQLMVVIRKIPSLPYWQDSRRFHYAARRAVKLKELVVRE